VGQGLNRGAASYIILFLFIFLMPTVVLCVFNPRVRFPLRGGPGIKLWQYIVKRLLYYIPTLIGLTVIVFALMHVGGVYKLIAVYINPRLTGAARQQQIQMLIQKFHLNQPIYVQYFYWLASVLQGNLGYTNTPIFSGPVTQAIALFFPNTALLAVLGGILTWLLGIPLGTWSAVRRDKPDDVAIRVFSYTLYGMPIYLIAVVLIIIFAVWLKVLPISGTVNATLVAACPGTGTAYLIPPTCCS